MAKRRSYDSPARREAARATRASIIAAARDPAAGGYDGMTVARLADTAGVSPKRSTTRSAARPR